MNEINLEKNLEFSVNEKYIEIEVPTQVFEELKSRTQNGNKQIYVGLTLGESYPIPFISANKILPLIPQINDKDKLELTNNVLEVSMYEHEKARKDIESIRNENIKLMKEEKSLIDPQEKYTKRILPISFKQYVLLENVDIGGILRVAQNAEELTPARKINRRHGRGEYVNLIFLSSIIKLLQNENKARGTYEIFKYFENLYNSTNPKSMINLVDKLFLVKREAPKKDEEKPVYQDHTVYLDRRGKPFIEEKPNYNLEELLLFRNNVKGRLMTDLKYILDLREEITINFKNLTKKEQEVLKRDTDACRAYVAQVKHGLKRESLDYIKEAWRTEILLKAILDIISTDPVYLGASIPDLSKELRELNKKEIGIHFYEKVELPKKEIGAINVEELVINDEEMRAIMEEVTEKKSIDLSLYDKIRGPILSLGAFGSLIQPSNIILASKILQENFRISDAKKVVYNLFNNGDAESQLDALIDALESAGDFSKAEEMREVLSLIQL